MFPPLVGNLNIEALSGICGSISLVCWVVVFSPQIIENFRRGSADGLSLLFLIVWLAGDVFNILGAVMQGVLPTMIILAVYYTLADIVLLGQCFYYRGFNLREEFSSSPTSDAASGASGEGADSAPAPTEQSALLPKPNGHAHNQDPHVANNGHQQHDVPSLAQGRRHSATSFRDILHSVDGTHLSPATPLIDANSNAAALARRRQRRISTIQAFLFNTTAIALVCTAGVLGWYFSPASKKPSSEPEPLTMDTMGQVFGYLCAALYLGSRLPQILLNFRRKSTDGVSFLFFLFACIGNLTYVLSILAYSPVCRGTESVDLTSHHHHRPKCAPGETTAIYGRYILVNLSWLIGSFGTLLLDGAIFVQFFLYRDAKDIDEHDE
ncbi:hypothetical protein N7451_008383 [Penicillium sp. IBT 35674x]|nr:hypothetical protein N7451_008383 [Penicillium sp. IBT 35674x]